MPSPHWIVDHFDLDTLRVIDEQSGRLIDARSRTEAHREDHLDVGGTEAIKEVMLFLQTVGVSTSIAVRMLSSTPTRRSPWCRRHRLAAEVWGIGFKTEDAIAQAVGILHESP